MDLQHQTGLRQFLPQAFPHRHHSQLHDVRRGALDGHVQGHSLPEGTEVEVGGLQLRQVPPPVEQRLHIALLPGPLHNGVHIRPDAWEGGEVGLHIRLGLRHAHADVLAQGEGGDAVDDAEVHCLGLAAHLMSYLVRRHVEHLGRRLRVEVPAGAEGGDHGLVPSHVGQQPQLDLGVVGVH